MKELNIRELEHSELMDGAYLLGRAMRDNPNNMQAFNFRSGDLRLHPKHSVESRMLYPNAVIA